MKAIFKLNNKIIENEKIENISLLIKLGEEFEDKDDNEEYVINSLKNTCKIFELDRFEIECPYGDLVYLSNESFTGEGEEGVYPSNEDELQLLINSYNEAVKSFNKDKVRIAVYSNYLYDNCNEDDFTLEEFLNSFKLIGGK